MQPDFSIENKFNNFLVLGIDEAGRGPLAGPVVAACVILDKNNFPKEINDSKKLNPKKRKEIFENLKKTAKIGVGIVDCKKIDEINILQATKLAMFEAYLDLKNKYKILPEIILVDGNFSPFNLQDNIKEIIPVVKGDKKSLFIAAASIVAKEFRDSLMLEIHNQYPQYRFDKHKGYPTKFHVEKIKEFGVCKYHRKTFEPIKSMLK